MTTTVFGIVAAIVIALVAGLCRYRVTIHADDTLIDDLIREKGVGADPLHRSGIIVFHKPKA